MTDLVERVTAAINGGFTESEHAKQKARLAIREVAAWLREQMKCEGDICDGCDVLYKLLKKELERRNNATLEN